MRLRDEREPEDARSTEAQPAAGEADGHGAFRDDGHALLAAADAAIARALSQNSAEFLAQNRQLGGQ